MSVSRLQRFLIVLSGCLLYFCLSFIYNGLRPLKITLVTLASSAGAEIIPFLKICGVLPGAFLFMYLYTRLCKRLSRSQIFYVFLAIFLSYFFLFAIILYPFTQFFALNSLAQFLRIFLPSGFRGLIAMLEYWHLSLFYVLCEVWSSAVMFVLFWGFMNETSSMDDASRHYPFYNLFGNLAAAVSGYVIRELSFLDFNFIFLSESSKIYCCYFVNIMLCIFVGIISLFLFSFLSKKRQIMQHDENLKKEKKEEKKESYSIWQSLLLVLRSRYLFSLLILSISYNAIFTLFDTLWSQSVKDYFASDQISIVRFLANVQILKGVLSTLLAFSVPVIIKYAGWKKTALVTPIFLLLSAISLFPLFYFKDHPDLVSYLFDFFGVEVIWILAYVGALQNAISRGSKYSLYDTTKEMAFIPLPLEEKRKGKTVIDGVASRFGKASGAILFMTLLPICGSLSGTIPYLIVVSFFVLIAWIYAINYLSRFMKKKS